jgi:hypothetical protein
MNGFPPAARAPKPSRGGLAAALAGLQGGMLGGLWMLAWLGVSSAWEQRSIWTPENLFATAFYGGSAIGPGFGRATPSGLALYLLLYSLLGAAFATALHGRLPRAGTRLLAVLFGAAWYFVSFHWLWKTAIPLAYLLHAGQPTFLGHLIYGTFLGRFPKYLEPAHTGTTGESAEALPPAPPAEPSAMPVPAQSSSPADPV